MKILHISAEMAPVAKVGGLGDVVWGLALAQKKFGHDVSVILPRYDILQSAYINNISIEAKHLIWNYYGTDYHHNIWKGSVDELETYFVDPLHPGDFFDRGRIYGCHDDIVRFLYYSRTVVEFLKSQKKLPDVVHVHDWQSAACIPLIRAFDLKIPKVIFTIHNMEYQGRCSPDEVRAVGIQNTDVMFDDLYPEAVNLLKGAILSCDKVTTVSPTYANEARVGGKGMGLEKTLEKAKEKFSGILNGIDNRYWNPKYDDYLPRHYTERSALRGKEIAKDTLRRRLQMEVSDKPLVANVGRLVPQKGVHLLRGAIHYTLERGGQFILQGTSPIEEIKKEFLRLKENFADHPDVHLELHLEEELTHMIYAAADLFIVPSIFEPCGLTQLIAMKYGAIPVVRKTGGLADTVIDLSNGKSGNGFVFEDPSQEALNSAIDRGISLWQKDKTRWNSLVLKGIASDFGWARPAKEYLEIYR